MTIPFTNIPSNIRVPLFYAEVDPSHANNAQEVQRALIIGQITASGTGVAGTPMISQGVDDAKTVGGQGSMLARMTAAYRANDTAGEVWYLPLADDGAAVAANGSVKFTSPATASGTLSLYIGGQRVQMLVTTTLTLDNLATNLAAAINAIGDLPVTAAVNGVDTTKVDITAKNAGAAGNDIDLRFNYRGSAGGEALPAGLAATITAFANGVTNPVLTAGLANLMDMPFDFIVCPYTDTTSLDALKSFLDDATGRWSWEVQVYGHVFAAYRGTVANLTTFGTARNDQHASVMGFYDSPTPAEEWAAAVAARAAVSLRADPGRPLQTLTIKNVLAPPLASRFTLSERNTLLFDGVSTFTVANDGTVAIENLITTYQKNGFGAPDNSYLQIETLFLLTFVLRDLKTIVTSKFARMKLADDGTRFAPGSAIVTPNIVRSNLIAEYRALEYEGYVQDSAAFATDLIVERNANDVNRLDVLWPGTLINQLRVFAVLAQFRL